MRILFFSFLCTISFNFLITPSSAQTFSSIPPFIELAGLNPSTDYRQFETEHFKLIYPTNYFSFAKISAEELEKAHQILQPILKWTPRQKTTVLVTDNQDAANGFAMPAFRVGIVLIATPPDAAMSTAYSENWIKLLVFHEYVHLLNLDATTGAWEGLRILFGDIVRPNGLWPAWMIEGLAVYYETKTSKLGRGRSPYYEGIVRSYFFDQKLGGNQKDALTLDRVNGEFPYYPGGEVPYLFGYHLWQELAVLLEESRKYDQSLGSPINEVAGEYSIRSSRRFPYLINGNLENITERTWPQVWQSFLTRTSDRMTIQSQTLTEADLTPFERVTNARYQAQGGAFSPDGKWFGWNQFSLEDPRPGTYIRNLKTGEENRIDDKALGVGITFTPDSKWMIYSGLRQKNSFFSYTDLLAHHLDSGKTIQITHGLRAKDPSISPDGKKVTFIQNIGATNTVAIADLSWNQDRPVVKNVKTIYTPREFGLISTPRFLKNSSKKSDEVIFSIQQLNDTGSDLISVEIKSGALTPWLSDQSMNRFPYPTQNGILFTSDQTGIENTYFIDKPKQKPRRITHVIGGSRIPFEDTQGELYSSLITSNGIEIVHFKKSEGSPSLPAMTVIPSAPESNPAAVGSAPSLPISEATSTSVYRPVDSLWPRQWAPIAFVDFGSRRGTSIFGDILGFDSTGKHSYLLGAGYRFKTKTVDATANYLYYGWVPNLTLGASAFTTDIAADAAQTQFRRTYEAFAQLEYPIFWTFSSLRPRLYGFLNWNSVRDLATGNRVASALYEYSQPVVPGLGASVRYSFLGQSPLAFIPESGIVAYAATEARFNERSDPFWKYLTAVTTYIHLGNHFVLQPRARYLGTTAFLGSENSSVLLEQGSGFNLDRNGIRGYPNALFLARGAATASFDFYFPIEASFSGDGTTPFFARQVYGFVFGETTYLPSTRVKDFYLPTVGAGVTLDSLALLRVPVQFTLQVQRGLRPDRGGDSIVTLGIGSNAL